MTNALFPGTFDPPSLGHFDIIQRASSLCDQLFVGIAVNRNKTKQLFSPEEKVQLIQKMTQDLGNVTVVCFSGLVVEFANEHDITYLVRGLRAFSDFEYEFRMALANRKLSGLETMFLMADEKYSYISSSLIRDIAINGKRLHDFIPEVIEETVSSRLRDHRT